MTIHLEKLCRTCMAESMTLISIWSLEKSNSNNTNISLESPSLAVMLTALTSSNISHDDELPMKMCLNCVSEMNQAFAFKQKCERSERTLRSFLEQSIAKTKELSVDDSMTDEKNNQQFQNSDDFVCDSEPLTHSENHSCTELVKNEVSVIEEVVYESVELSSPTSRPSDSAAEEAVKDFIAETTLKFKCTHCNASFSSRRSLNLHANSRKCMQQSYECDICSKVFIKKRYLIRHLQRMHKIRNEDPKNDDEIDSKSDKRKYKCHLCSKAFTMSSSLKDHLRIHTGERPYLCSICGKGFTQNSNLRQHLMRHNQSKPYKCVKCSANFVSKGELVSHNRTHTGDHPFTCEICNTGFTTSSSLVKHRRIHTGERPYQCDLCPLRFSALGTMKNHRRTHTGEKPYQCGVCSRSFSQRTDCISHLKTHSDNRSYECKKCNLSFTESSSLKLHMHSHNVDQTDEGNE